MLLLLGTTIATSFLDSLNPSAIAQQMILQSMVKTKRHIWFFILGIGLANLILGLAVYYGIVAWVSRLLSLAVTRYPIPLFSLALIAGAVCFMWGICWIRKTHCTQASQGDKSTKEPASLSPISLFIMGAAFCAVELTSALPYFGFLTLLTGYQLAFPAAHSSLFRIQSATGNKSDTEVGKYSGKGVCIHRSGGHRTGGRYFSLLWGNVAVDNRPFSIISENFNHISIDKSNLLQPYYRQNRF